MLSEGGDLEVAAEARIDEIDLDLGHTVERRFTIGENDPLTAHTEIRERITMRRASWSDRRARRRPSSLATAKRSTSVHWLAVREGEPDRVRPRSGTTKIPRDLV